MEFEDLQFFNPYAEIRQTGSRLPHWQQQGAVFFLTFHLGDALPAAFLEPWISDRDTWLRLHPEPWTGDVEQEYHARFSAAKDQWLDAGHGACCLRQPECAQRVADALTFFEG